MNASTVHAPATVSADAALVELIVTGRHTDAMTAIGRADVPTLRLASERCRAAEYAALASHSPASAYRTRGQFCRRRLQIIGADEPPKPHTVRL